MNVNDDIAPLLKLGLGLVHIPRGTKGPRTKDWQKNPVTTLEHARAVWAHGGGVGVHHDYSRSAVLDVDEEAGAKQAFAAVGLDLGELLDRPGPKIRGKNGLKPLYRLPEGAALSRKALVWRPPGKGAKAVTVFELRGGTVQDVLPPTEHPETGKPYEWVPHLPEAREDIPLLPDELLEMWQNWPTFEARMAKVSPWYTPAPSVAGRTEANGGVIGAYNLRYTVRVVLERNGYNLEGFDGFERG